MSLLIVTSRYLKSGTAKTKSQRKNYTKYIATRESVEVREQSKKYSTDNQKKLLNVPPVRRASKSGRRDGCPSPP